MSHKLLLMLYLPPNPHQIWGANNRRTETKRKIKNSQILCIISQRAFGFRYASRDDVMCSFGKWFWKFQLCHFQNELYEQKYQTALVVCCMFTGSVFSFIYIVSFHFCVLPCTNFHSCVKHIWSDHLFNMLTRWIYSRALSVDRSYGWKRICSYVQLTTWI